ncbi:MAG: hypothetical protein ABI978_00195 [Chloroflexota bacterium]
MNKHPALRVLVPTCAVLLALLSTDLAAAHVVKQAGTYTIEIGWQHEPTYVGEANGVQVIVHDAAGKPITDLAEDDVKVVVSTAGQQSGELTLAPGFDLEEGFGTLGEYNAAIEPTAPGNYTFHLTGAIHGQPVDITVTSSDTTFDSVKGMTEIQFPAKLPTLTELVTRLDRIDSRLAANGTGPTQAAVDAAQASADKANQAAARALLVGGGIGLAGLIVVLWSLMAARRRGQVTRR